MGGIAGRGARFAAVGIAALAIACAPGRRGGGNGENSVEETKKPAERLPAGSQAAESAMTTATDRDDGREIVLAISDSLEVRLTAVPGTGYGWKVKTPAPEMLRLEDEHLDFGGGTMPGGSATAVFRWTAVRAGEGMLMLEYNRPWEKDKPPKKTYTLRVKVK